MQVVRQEQTPPPAPGGYESAKAVAATGMEVAGGAVAGIPRTALALSAMGYVARAPGTLRSGFRWKGLPTGTGLSTMVGTKKGIFRAATLGTFGGTAMLSSMGVNPVAAFGVSAGMNLAPRILGGFTGEKVTMTGIGGLMQSAGLTVPGELNSLVQGGRTLVGKLGPLDYATSGDSTLLKKMAKRDKMIREGVDPARIRKQAAKTYKRAKQIQTVVGGQSLTDDITTLSGKRAQKYTRNVKRLITPGLSPDIAAEVGDDFFLGQVGRPTMGTVKETATRKMPGYMKRAAAREKLLTTSIFERVGPDKLNIFGRQLTGETIRGITGYTKYQAGAANMAKIFGKAGSAEAEIHLMRAFRETTLQSSMFSRAGKATDLFVKNAVTQYGDELAKGNAKKANAAIQKLSKGFGIGDDVITGAVQGAAGKGTKEIVEAVSTKISKNMNRTLLRTRVTQAGFAAGRVLGVGALGIAIGGGIFGAATKGARKLDDAIRNMNDSMRGIEMGGRGAFSNDVVSTERQRAIGAMQFLRSGRDFIGKEARLIAESY